ncbi:MAG: thioesterase family protein [Polyangiaceae bacterium]
MSANYRWFCDISTRWMDNDLYGHINNVTYYSYFDTAANLYLIGEGRLDITTSNVIGVVAESTCSYRAALAYPTPIRAGLRVDKLGQRSVRYGIGIFSAQNEMAAAFGSFVHVFVDRASRAPVAIPEKIRSVLARICITSA